MTLRWLVSRLYTLPEDSRVMRAMTDYRFSRLENLVAEVIDGMDTVAYFTSVGAVAQVEKGSRESILKGRPKPRSRPGIAEEIPEDQRTIYVHEDNAPMQFEKTSVSTGDFTTTDAANAMFTQWTKRQVIDHIPGCQPIDGECGCPRS